MLTPLRSLWLFVILALPLTSWGETYYVGKNGSPVNSCFTASQSNGCTASGTCARLTINQGIACLSGGDTLILGNGVYDEALSNLAGWQPGVVVIPSGSASAYTTIKAANRRQAIIRYTQSSGENNAIVTLEGGSYMAFEGLTMDKQYDVARLTRAFQLYAGVSNLRFVDNEFANGQGGAGEGHNIEVLNCDQYGSGYNYSGDDVCTGCDGVTHCPGYCHGYYLQGSSSNWTFDGGSMRQNSGYGVQYGNGVTVRNIRFEDLQRWAVINHFAVTAYNNLIVNTQGGFLVGGGTVRHNSFLNVETAIYTEGSITVTNNILVNTSPDFVPGGSNMIGVDPRWVNPPSDLHLQSDSPAINAGGAVPPEYMVDRDGNARTGAPDMGAYEFVSAAPPVASALAFVQQPGTTSVGAVLSPPVTVQVRDQFGNPFGVAATITLEIGNNPGGATLQGTLTQQANASGLATFANLSLTAGGVGYSLIARSTGPTLPATTSTSFTITTPVATRLAFGPQHPSNMPAGSPMTPPLQVRIMDQNFVLIPTATHPVTLALDQNPAGATFTPQTVNAVNGIASFPSIVITTVGTGYTFRATSPGITEDLSDFFAVTPAVPTSPAAPSNLRSLADTVATNGQLQLGWDYAQGSVLATGFVVQRQDACTGAWADRPGMPLAVTTLTYTDTALNPANTYCWRVVAVDAEADRSTPSNTYQFTGGTIPPPTDLTVHTLSSGFFIQAR